MQSLLNEILHAEANSGAWHPECASWIMSKVLATKPSGGLRRPEAALDIVGRCLTVDRDSPDSSCPAPSNVAVAIQVVHHSARASHIRFVHTFF